jgi:nicotinate-nucleotide pyrophosphorylase (carboxylating)
VKKLFASQIAHLSMKQPAYRKFVSELLEVLYKADVGSGDITTALLGNSARKMEAKITAKENGILTGVEEAVWFLTKHGVKVKALVKDGGKVKKGKVFLELSGSAKNILTVERVVLNLLQRMSGIATAAHHVAKKIGVRKFAATRKTPWGLLDSKAVVVGGGLPHRLNLADLILVKENHIRADKNCWQKIKTTKSFEIEADSEKLAIKIAEFFGKQKNLILLLDNFSPKQLKKLIPKLRKINPQITLEGSGGITPKHARKFLAAGVDYISMGYLTHSAKALDLSLKIESN